MLSHKKMIKKEEKDQWGRKKKEYLEQISNCRYKKEEKNKKKMSW